MEKCSVCSVVLFCSVVVVVLLCFVQVHELKRPAFTGEQFIYRRYHFTMSEYLDGVRNRQSPKELEEEFHMEILSIEVLGQVAVSKVKVPMLGYNYYDFLSLSMVDGEWKIVNKVFTHVA